MWIEPHLGQGVLGRRRGDRRTVWVRERRV